MVHHSEARLYIDCLLTSHCEGKKRILIMSTAKLGTVLRDKLRWPFPVARTPLTIRAARALLLHAHVLCFANEKIY